MVNSSNSDLSNSEKGSGDERTVKKQFSGRLNEPASKRKRSSNPENFENFNASTNNQPVNRVRERNIRRIQTQDGWVQFRQWLNDAQEQKNHKKIIDLLETCLEAEISYDLLKRGDVDTPKLVNKLACKHPNEDIKKLAGDLINKWKDVVVAGKIQEETNAVEEVREGENTEQHANNSGEQNQITDPTDATSGLNNSGETNERSRVRPKVKLSKPRLTGLETDPPVIFEKVSKKKKPSIRLPNRPATSINQFYSNQPAFYQRSSAFNLDHSPLYLNQPTFDLSSPASYQNSSAFNLNQPTFDFATHTTQFQQFDESPTSFTDEPEHVPDPAPITRGSRGALRMQPLSSEEKSTRKLRFSDDFGGDLQNVQYIPGNENGPSDNSG